jgi:hypothetical protein
MDVRPEVFADGMGEITLTGGMVRIDFVCLSAENKDKDGRPVLELRQRVVMPPDGFLRSYSAMEDLMQKLIKAGVVKQRPGGNESAAATNQPAGN